MACTEKNYWFQATERKPTFGVRAARGFTGKRGDHYYYRGRRWFGPTNAIGKPGPEGRIAILDNNGDFGAMPI